MILLEPYRLFDIKANVWLMYNTAQKLWFFKEHFRPRSTATIICVCNARYIDRHPAEAARALLEEVRLNKDRIEYAQACLDFARQLYSHANCELDSVRKYSERLRYTLRAIHQRQEHKEDRFQLTSHGYAAMKQELNELMEHQASLACHSRKK